MSDNVVGEREIKEINTGALKKYVIELYRERPSRQICYRTL